MARVTSSMSARVMTSGLCLLALGGTAAAQTTGTQVRPASAAAGPVRVLRQLNTPRRFYGPLGNAETVRRMMARRNMPGDVAAVLQAAGVGHLAADVTRVLTAASPADLREVSVPVGRRMEWMAQRTRGRPDLLRTVEWGGRAAFPAFEFFIDDGQRGYTFILPKVCGNLALVSVGGSPRADAVEAARRAEEARKADEARRAEEASAAEARKAEEARKVEEARKADEARRADEARKAEEARKADEARRADEARKAEAARQAAEAAEAAERDRRAKVDWFLGVLGGKERRVREFAPATAGQPTFLNGRCAPLVGFKVGPDVRLGGSGWRLAPSVGVAINARDGDNTSLFGEAELNYWIRDKGFIGTGAGVWDFNHSDTVAGTWMVQGGRELGRTASDVRFLFVAEGRLFFDQFDDIANNYQAWGGLRVVFR